MVFDVRVLGPVEAVSTAQHSLHNVLPPRGCLTRLACLPSCCCYCAIVATRRQDWCLTLSWAIYITVC